MEINFIRLNEHVAAVRELIFEFISPEAIYN
jgi:hypothetical protein